ncbi:hypothetical protein HY495_01160 [Candidatus Woesearchaeota archaeon]|nr:hypothetical protein [Candidatus Woesearchaeota archaeon]
MKKQVLMWVMLVLLVGTMVEAEIDFKSMKDADTAAKKAYGEQKYDLARDIYEYAAIKFPDDFNKGGKGQLALASVYTLTNQPVKKAKLVSAALTNPELTPQDFNLAKTVIRGTINNPALFPLENQIEGLNENFNFENKKVLSGLIDSGLDESKAFYAQGYNPAISLGITEDDFNNMKKQFAEIQTSPAHSSPGSTPSLSSPAYRSITDIQLALQQKKITTAQAYEEAKKINEATELKLNQPEMMYIQNLRQKYPTITDEGKIPVTIIGVVLDQIIPEVPRDIKLNVRADSLKVTDFKVGDTVYYDYDPTKKVQLSRTITKVESGKVYYSNNDQKEVFFTNAILDKDDRIISIFESDVSLSKRKNEYIEKTKKEYSNTQDYKNAKEQAEEARKFAESIQWQGSWLEALEQSPWYGKGAFSPNKWGAFIGGGFQAVASVGSYRALSNLLFPETTEAWSEWANSETINRWASLPSTTTEDLCKDDDTKRANRPGQSAVFITTSAGTHQSVGAVSAERSPAKFPILCTKNKDDEWTCPKNLVCNDDTFCFKDKTAAKPEEGYFYKITWAVKAPVDEKFTRFVDEAGNAAKFNVFLVGPNGDVPLYTRKGITDPKKVIQLVKGDSDGGMIIRYLPGEYSQVCVRFADDGFIKDRDGDDIHEFCNTITLSDGGVNEYTQSARLETITSTSAGVELNI